MRRFIVGIVKPGVGVPRGENEWRGLNSQFNSYSQSKNPNFNDGVFDCIFGVIDSAPAE